MSTKPTYWVLKKADEKGKSLDKKPAPIKSTPADHIRAALHHATWWAGHQGEYDRFSTDQEVTPDEAEFTANDSGHIGKARRHLNLARAHLKEAGVMRGRQIIWDHPELSEINQPYSHKANLLSDVETANPDQAYSHVGGHSGTHISHYGPEGVHGARDTNHFHIASYAEESDSGEHPLDAKLQEKSMKKNYGELIGQGLKKFKDEVVSTLKKSYEKDTKVTKEDLVALKAKVETVLKKSYAWKPEKAVEVKPEKPTSDLKPGMSYAQAKQK